MRRLVEDDVSGHPPNKTTATHTERDDDGEEEEEEEYFSTYSHFSIHHEMLSDRVRTGAYQTFISKNTALFKDKVRNGIVCECVCMHACVCVIICVGGVRRWLWHGHLGPVRCSGWSEACDRS